MRDPARIPPMCEQLQRAWLRSPDLRLGQLVVNAIQPATPCPAVFHAEDGALRRGLERMARKRAEVPELPSARDVNLSWEELSEAVKTTVTFDGARLAEFEVDALFCGILQLYFGGEYREGSLGNPDAAAIDRHVIVMLAQAEPDVVVLDFSAMRYVWGNSILRVFQRIARFDQEHPVGIVVRGGPNSAPALTTLGCEVHMDEAAALEDAKAQAVRRSADIG